MAKVMVSLPDELLRTGDMETARRGTTRSGYVRQLVEKALRWRGEQGAACMADIDALADGPRGHGGDVANLVKVNQPKG